MQNKVSILCTRPVKDFLIQEANASGIEVDILSFIETEPIENIEVQQEVEHALLLSAPVIFTSMNAVEAVAEFMLEEQPDWRIYCIGKSTSRLVKEHFGGMRIAGTADSASELADTIIENEETDEVIFFCGDQRRNELPDKLKEHDIAVDEIVVYQTLETAHKINKHYHGILFFSPSAVDSFFSVNKANEQTVYFAIGKTTADTIKKYAGNKIIVSDRPGKDSLFEKAVEYFS